MSNGCGRQVGGPCVSIGRRVRTIVVSTLGVVVGMVATALAEDGFGPFPVRNFQPIQLQFLGMFGDRARVLEKGQVSIRVELAETAAIFNEYNLSYPTSSAVMKFETLRTGILWRYGVTDRFEMALELPILYRYEGFLEGAIEWVEEWSVGLNPARDQLRNVPYAYDVQRGGQTLFAGSKGALGFGDLSLMSKYQVLGERDRVPALSLRLGLKLPTGDVDEVYGSGHVDVGAGVALEKKLAQRWILYANVNGIFPTGTVSGLPLKPFFSGILALEYLWSPAFSVVAHLDYYDTPFSDTGLKLLDLGASEVVVGFNYRIRWSLLWQVYGVENLDFPQDSAADFTLATTLTYRFGT